MSAMIQYVLYLAILVVLAIPLGAYIKNVMSGEKTFLSKVLTPCENLIYKVMRVDREEQMTWKKYAVSVMIFSGIGLVFLFLLQLLQGVLPGNPQNLSGVKWDLAFNTSASFITNTNWQAYSGESTLSYLTQALGLTVQNFVSAATGIAVLFALIRGFIKVKSSGLGSFWVDLTRIVVHILLPLNLIISLLLVGGGVIQNLKSAETVSLVEPIAVSAEGEILEDAVIDLDTETVTVDGEIVSDAQIVTEQFVPMGPAASQVAIKQTGTNGGGYMGVNSAHPLENPNAFTNLIEMISILLIPAALCFTFGSAVKNKRQGIAIFMAMFLCLVVALSCIAVTEQVGTPQLAQNGAVNMSMAEQAGGNMEGKETRFGIAGSSTWAAFTTAASNGSVNSMHDSYTPLGGMVTMLLMQLGEVVFGGVGCGLYGMLAFAILTVFIAGLMVGRTPEFLGKKMHFVPFTAVTRMSGVDFDGNEIRKGAADAMQSYVTHAGGMYSPDCDRVVKSIASKGGTPLVVAKNHKILGVIYLKDIIKQGVKEKFADLRKMGIKTIMITGDNPITASAIAAEAGVDDFLAEATPEGKLAMIRDFQAKGHLVAMTGDGTNDAPALAQADVAVAMNSGTQAAKEAGNMVDLDSSPTKLIDIVRIGKQLLMTRGSLTTFSIANDVAKYFAIIPALFMGLYPGLSALNIMGLHSPQSAVLSAIIYNALIIIALIPLALKGVKYREVSAGKLLSRNLLVYGLGGLAAPFIFVKLIDVLLVFTGLV